MLFATRCLAEQSPRGRDLFPPFAFIFFLTLTSLFAGGEPPRLTRYFFPVSQKIPLLLDQSGGKVTLNYLQLRCESLEETQAVPIPEFQFLGESDSAEFESFRSQLWISALASAMAWQQSWMSVRWTLSEIPTGDVSDNGAALGIALISTAAGTEYPQDTVILGRLHPDGSLGATTNPEAKLRTAAAAGMKRVVIPNLQRIEISPQGDIRNIPALADKLGLECVAVDDLTEATEVVLRRKLPPITSSQTLPRYPLALSTVLEARCRAEFAPLREDSKSWPRTAAQLQALPPAEQLLWKKVFQSYDLGMESYRAGKLYVARQLLRETQSRLRGLAEIKSVGNKFDYAAFNARAEAIRKKMVERMTKSTVDKNELQSAVVLAEESDWLRRINASVENAQIVARQAFDSRSEATDQQKTQARVLLMSAVASAEYQMKEANFLETQYALLVNKDEVPIYDRAPLWLPQLRQAQFGVANFFMTGLKTHSGDLDENLLFDSRLGGMERGLRENKIAWEQQKQASALQAAQERPVPVVKIGFVPGEGYSEPKAPTPPPTPSKLSEAALCLAWVNDFCELSSLDEKYLRLGATFDPNTLEWRVKENASLQSMLQIAELGARRGIAFAEKVGVDTTTLDLIYEVASTLRSSDDNNLKLEGLRQYWRCALLGSLSWQLGYIPRAVAEAPETLTASATPLRLPTPSPITVSTSQAPLPIWRNTIITAPPPYPTAQRP